MHQAGCESDLPFVGLCAGRQCHLSQLLCNALLPVRHPSLAEAVPGQLTQHEVLQCRRTLAMLGSTRQYPICGRWGADALQWMLAPAFQDAFGAIKFAGAANVKCLSGPEEMQRALRLPSVGGALALGPFRCIAARMVDEADALTTATGLVDCVVRRDDGSLVGHSTERTALRMRLTTLGLDAGAAGRVGLIFGSGSDEARVAAAALRELGFGRLLVVTSLGGGAAAGEAHADRRGAMLTMEVDRMAGGELGLDLSHDPGDHRLRVELVSGGLVGAWNAQQSPADTRILPGDCLVEVNGKGGDVASLVEELGRPAMLRLTFVRGGREEDKAAATLGEPLSDLASLATLSTLDVVVLAEPSSPSSSTTGGGDLADSQWLLNAIARLRPVVIETIWPPPPASPSQASVFEAARAAGSVVVEAPELFFEQACACLQLWTGGQADLEALRKVVARRLVRELAMSDSPREAPSVLVDATTASAGTS